MSVLVTGATGFLGAPLVDRLLHAGVRDLRIGVRPGSRRERLDAVLARHGARAELVPGNLLSPAETARALDGVTTVYHLAASLRGAPADMTLHTVVGSKNLLEAAAGRKLRFVLVSSFSVYGVAGLPRGATVDENTPLETEPQRRDPYAQVKLRQERLFEEAAALHGFELAIVRPGVIYGPGGSPFSTRVGLQLPGLFLSLGGSNLLPLSYVDNCAEAIVVAGQARGRVVVNVHDDDLPTCRAYLKAYRRAVAPIRTVPVPYPALRILSSVVERYNRMSRGQLPAIFTPYKSATAWGGNRFDNAHLKSLGWRQLVPTEEGMRRTFEWLKQR